MKHNLSISISKKPRPGGVVNIRNVCIRERFLRLLLGAPQRLTIIVPGGSVETVVISELEDGGSA